MPGLFGGFGNNFVPIFQGSPEVVYSRVNSKPQGPWFKSPFQNLQEAEKANLAVLEGHQTFQLPSPQLETQRSVKFLFPNFFFQNLQISVREAEKTGLAVLEPPAAPVPNSKPKGPWFRSPLPKPPTNRKTDLAVLEGRQTFQLPSPHLETQRCLVQIAPSKTSKSAFWRPKKPIWPFWKVSGSNLQISVLEAEKIDLAFWKAARLPGCPVLVPIPPFQNLQISVGRFGRPPDLPAAQSPTRNPSKSAFWKPKKPIWPFWLPSPKWV